MPNELHNSPAGAAGAQDARHIAVKVPLPELGVIRVSGPDGIAFLQAQLTNDVAGQGPDSLRLSGYCTPKGRLLATFHQWREGDDVLLRLPREIVAAVAKRLSMFVLRAKAKVLDASDAFSTVALLGPGSSERLQQAGLQVPAEPWQSTRVDGLRIDRVAAAPQVAERFLLTLAADASLPEALRAIPQGPSSAWWWSEIDAAIPTVFAATQEKFVPQMVNFEVLGGVNFRKGCYPGQEIVARSQYLGKLKRRMQIAHAAGAAPAAGADVFAADGSAAVGTVVMAAAAPAGGTDLLFEAPIGQLSASGLHLGASDGPPLDMRPLPYALFDPTA
jgi:tRNA-modifying protein YgfZ